MTDALAARTIALSFLVASITHAAPVVKLGIDVLHDDGFKLLAGKRVGLICNPASVDDARKPTVLVLKDGGVNLVAARQPEHGIWGDEYAGDKVGDKTDTQTGLKVFSLYGKSHKPSQPFMDEVDAIVVDLQDIGARSYTYISSMKVVLQACAEQDKELIILDRPNPLGGLRVEGSRVAGKRFESFVSFLDVPYLHGMTMGELATMTRDEIAPDYKKLTVVKMQGWRREMTWSDTGLDWIMTSPHVPHVSSVAAYAATGIMGELYQYSNGVGYTLPFEIVGGPGVDGVALAEKLNGIWPNEPGVFFRAMRFKPFYATNVGERCEGVQVHLDPHTAPSLVEINYRLIEALGGENDGRIDAADDRSRDDDDDDARDAAKQRGAIDIRTRRAMFDKVTGSDDIGDALARGADLAPVFATWREECDAFKAKRAKYLLY